MDANRACPGPGLATAAMLAVALAACSRTPAPGNPAQVPQVSVVTVHRGTVPVTTELPGRTSPYLVAQVRARVDGIVQRRDLTGGGGGTPPRRLLQIEPRPCPGYLCTATASLWKAHGQRTWA